MTAPASPATGGRLPALTLPARDGGPDVKLRAPGRLATVLVALHGDCARCEAYLAALAAQEAELRDWDGRVVAVRVGRADAEPAAGSSDGEERAQAAPHRLGERVRVAADPERRLASAGITVPAVLIADQWGELFVVEPAGAGHALVAPAEIVAWLRYLAVQCPECQGEAL